MGMMNLTMILKVWMEETNYIGANEWRTHIDHQHYSRVMNIMQAIDVTALQNSASWQEAVADLEPIFQEAKNHSLAATSEQGKYNSSSLTRLSVHLPVIAGGQLSTIRGATAGRNGPWKNRGNRCTRIGRVNKRRSIWGVHGERLV
jgi:hypothetical protein